MLVQRFKISILSKVGIDNTVQRPMQSAPVYPYLLSERELYIHVKSIHGGHRY